MHDIDKIVSNRCAETEEGLERPKEMSPWRYRSISADCPEDCGGASSTVYRQSRGRASGQEPGDAEDFGSCCTKCYSDVEPFTDIPPDSVATTAVQAQTAERTRSLYVNSPSVERPHQVHQVTTQEVMVPVAGVPPSTWTFCTRTPWCRLRKRLWRCSRCRPSSV